MDKNKICEALYALPEGVVVRRRKSIVMPALVLLAGAALIILNNYLRDAISDDLRSALVFVGGIAALVGFIMVLARLVGTSGTPYHLPTKSFLRYEELYFDQKAGHDVTYCVEQGEIERLRGLKPSPVPAVSVALYATRDGRFAAAQAFEYADLEYRPVTELRIVSR